VIGTHVAHSVLGVVQCQRRRRTVFFSLGEDSKHRQGQLVVPANVVRQYRHVDLRIRRRGRHVVEGKGLGGRIAQNATGEGISTFVVEDQGASDVVSKGFHSVDVVLGKVDGGAGGAGSVGRVGRAVDVMAHRGGVLAGGSRVNVDLAGGGGAEGGEVG